MKEKGTIKEIHNIRWLFTDEYDDTVLQGVATNRIFEHIKRIDKLPIISGEIYFSSNIWDFNSVTLKRVPKRKSTFNFNRVNSIYREAIKFFILVKVWEDKDKIQSIYHSYGNIIDFLNYLTTNDIYSLEYLSLQTVKTYFDTKTNLQPSTYQKYKHAINSFFQFYTSNYREFDWLKINKFLTKVDSIAIKAQREANKWDTIPDDYFDSLLSCLHKVMDDENALIDDRAISAMTIILSQTGLRNGEIRDIPINSLESTTILNGTKSAYYMRYLTSKGVKGNGNAKEVNTIMTDLACTAYHTLVKLYDSRRKEINSDLLYVPHNVRTLPVTENYLSRRLLQLCIKYREDIGCLNVKDRYPTLLHSDLNVIIERKEIAFENLKGLKNTDTISIPRPHQFRVKLCNELLDAGVSIYYVQRHMNHLKKEFTEGYHRRKEDEEKEKEYAESIMKMVVTGETSIMGDGKDNLTLQINQFLEQSELNVATDLDEIINTLTKKIPIRAKVGGICIKSGPIRECSKSDATDNFFCAYGMCNNLFHAFFMIDINYQKYTTLLKTIKYNQEKGFNKAVEKEKSKLKFIVEKFLIPEIEELKKEVQLKGKTSVKEKHPQVSFFIDNYEAVYEEVVAWLI